MAAAVLNVTVTSRYGPVFNPVAIQIADYVKTGNKVDEVKDAIYGFVNSQLGGFLTRTERGGKELRNCSEYALRGAYIEMNVAEFKREIETFLTSTKERCSIFARDNGGAPFHFDVTDQIEIFKKSGRRMNDTDTVCGDRSCATL